MAQRRDGRAPEDPHLLRALPPQQLACAKAPTVTEYTKALKKFQKAYPGVKDIPPWNEVNRCQAQRAGNVIGQPTVCHHRPKLAAQYYSAARKVFKGAKRSPAWTSSTSRTSSKTINYLKSFLRHAKPDPKFWGIHNYSDTNRFSTKRTKAC